VRKDEGEEDPGGPKIENENRPDCPVWAFSTITTTPYSIFCSSTFVTFVLLFYFVRVFVPLFYHSVLLLDDITLGKFLVQIFHHVSTLPITSLFFNFKQLAIYPTWKLSHI
jgi:hypothetical protein